MATNCCDAKDSQVLYQHVDGAEVSARLVRLGHCLAVFELSQPATVFRMSEVLDNLRIVIADRTVYSGRAVVSNLLRADTGVICEVKLEENGFNYTLLNSGSSAARPLREHFAEFLVRWQQNYRVRGEFKEVIADLQSLLTDLRLWTDQLELEIRTSPSGDRAQLERRVLDEISAPVVQAIDTFIDRFEEIVQTVELDLQATHRIYMRRQLHSLVLCSPFAYRAYHKPLGYAGDYELVDMMMRPPYEGGSLFGKLLNIWLLNQSPARAHRNRVEYLTGLLVQEALRARARNRRCRVYNLGCGPAVEIQQFLKEQALSDSVDFTLLDFNEETLAHVRQALDQVRTACGRSTPVQFIKRSVQQLLKQSARTLQQSPQQQYDLIYCAGLFDYLEDHICRRLMNLLYTMLAPGGLLMATNVSDAMNQSRPFRYSMEYLLDWHLIYRNGPQLAALSPDRAPSETSKVISEHSGVNVFLEVRKPDHG